ncbi:hypothetical protein [Aureimonas sp. AU4]|uniref:hypothetical protein n=1 Tax=Aureimonas sp. AU4 TaxID=1638163 RepID=UPI000784805D|nr:hypothetical protein [Aureimonas sp. AU4]
MSLIPSVSSTTRPSWDPAIDAAGSVPSATTEGDAAPAVPDAVPAASEILFRLGLAGLRLPSGTGDISVLLAQTLFGTEETRSDAERQRVATAATTALSLDGRFDTTGLQKDVETKQGERKTLAAARTTAVADVAAKQQTVERLQEQIDTQNAVVAEAKAAVAAAKTPEEKSAAEARLSAEQATLATLSTRKSGAEDALQAAQGKVADLDNQIAATDVAIKSLNAQITTLAKMQQTVAASLATRQASETQIDGLRSRAVDLDVEDLFAAIQDLAAQSLRNANPLLRDDALPEDDAATREPPPRPVAVAAALQFALTDLLRELNGFDPLLLARPPEQTGLDRLRLRV